MTDQVEEYFKTFDRNHDKYVSPLRFTGRILTLSHVCVCVCACVCGSILERDEFVGLLSFVCAPNTPTQEVRCVTVAALNNG